MQFTGDDARFTRRDGYMSPPFEDVDMPTGALMDSEHFQLCIRKTSQKILAMNFPAKKHTK